MKKRKHAILDHPILGYFLLMIFVGITVSIGNIADIIIAQFLPGYASEMTISGTKVTTANGVGDAMGALTAAWIFTKWFKPDFKSGINTKSLKKGLLMMLPVLIFHYTGSIISWFSYGIGNIFISVLKACSPGFCEEVIYRGLGVANYMRTIKTERQIAVIFWLSSLVFGAAHIMNIFVGGDPFSVFIQVFYAAGIGMMLGAVYLRTGNLLSTIIAHASLDCMEFIRGDLHASGGIMQQMGAGDWVTVAASVCAAVLALYLINPKYYPEIMEVWNKKWSKSTAEPEPQPETQK